MTTCAVESALELACGALMRVAFRASFFALTVGLALWLGTRSSDAGTAWLNAGLLGLLLNPALRLGTILATALRRRDWLLLGATLAVLLILSALTLRHAVSQPSA